MENTDFILFTEGGGMVAGGNQQTTTTTGETQTGEPVVAPGLGLFQIGLMVLMVVVMWFFIFRPQRRREKAIREMQNTLGVGENIVTTGGMFGKIVSVGTDSFLVEFGEGKGIRIWVRKSDISGIKTPTMTPPPAEPAAKG